MTIVPRVDPDLGTRSAPEGRRVPYANSAPVADVIFEQLDFLLNHRDHECFPDCEDCARLERVKYWLLLPFRPISTS